MRLLLGVFLVVPMVALATVWHVPTDPGAATIADALQSSLPGDSIIIAAGTYHEHDLVIPHYLSLEGATAEPERYLIDAQQQGRVLRVPAGVVVNLRWLTLTGGDADRGGGLLVEGSMTITEVCITGNTADYGGGIYAEGAVDYAAGRISANHSRTFGGGVFVHGAGQVLIIESAVVGNLADAGGGAWYAAGGGELQVETSTIADNRADQLAAEGAAFGAGPIAFVRVVSAYSEYNADVPVGEHYLIVSGVTQHVCTIRPVGGWSGLIADQEGVAGNLGADPRFCRRSQPADVSQWYGVAADSPCLPENSGGCGLIGAFRQACDVAVGVPAGAPARPCVLHAPAPNPFNPATMIRFEVRDAGRVRLEIYDLTGRRVSTLVNESLAAGYHETTWRGTDDRDRRVASGIYICRLQADGIGASRRLALVK